MELISVGGAANSRVWLNQSGYYGKTIHVPLSDQATTLGAALLAGVGVGVYPNFTDAVEKTVQIKEPITLFLKTTPFTDRFYQLYLELYQKLRDSFATLARITPSNKALCVVAATKDPVVALTSIRRVIYPIGMIKAEDNAKSPDQKWSEGGDQ